MQIKHGAYQSLYADMLNTEDKILFNMIQPTVNVDDEIRLLRLKIAGLLNREKLSFIICLELKLKRYFRRRKNIWN